jgi:hypothetical protein
MPVVQLVGNGQAQYGVTEELQALVGGQAPVLIGVAAMGQRQRQQIIGQVDLERGE